MKMKIFQMGVAESLGTSSEYSTAVDLFSASCDLAVTRMSREEAHALVDRAFDRGKSKIYDCVCNVLAKLAHFCETHNIKMSSCATITLAKLREATRRQP